MTGTVVLLPATQIAGHDVPVGNWRAEIAAELAAYSIPIFLPPAPTPLAADADERSAAVHWVAHIAVELTAALPNPPLLLVATGAAGAHLPALGFSQRASRHAVMGYVMVDAKFPRLPARTVDWPDAPVDVVTTPDATTEQLAVAHVAELRGWTVYRDADPAAVIRALLGR